MEELRKVIEVMCVKIFEICIKSIKKVHIYFATILIVIIISLLVLRQYPKYLKKQSYNNFYNASVRDNFLIREIDEKLLICNRNGIYIGLIIVKDEVMHFKILRGVLNSSPTIVITDTRMLNRFYTLEISLDSATEQYLISNYLQDGIVTIDYNISSDNRLIYFINLYRSLGVHGKIDSIVDKLYLMPYIENQKITFLVGLSFADATKYSFCNSQDLSSQKQILIDLKKRIIQTLE